ncbi:hypothetical protein KIN20_021830 [Parelaphostrongylus tenuis]|uniref:Uncharacterized protein n=1 Tax=Parelaphostrongylus tenuis TaxID=148309 RepID=A0AAD5MPD3_PARTN|nr:hypothetical protein KIN20_021830 [Parelaphostrongylus tenuis]
MHRMSTVMTTMCKDLEAAHVDGVSTNVVLQLVESLSRVHCRWSSRNRIYNSSLAI